MRLFSGIALALVLGCAPVAPAAQPSASVKPATAVELATYRGADRQQLLEAGARREGQVLWYTSMAGDIIPFLTDGFARKYPFVKVEVFRGDERELVTKATQEASAAQPSFDVLESQLTAIRLLYDAKLLTPYWTSGVARIPDRFKTKAADTDLVESATDRVSLVGFAYNTKLIPEGAVPRTQEDLLAPALKGKLALAGSSTGTRWLGSILEGLGETKGKEFLARFAKEQQPKVLQMSNKAVADLVAKGEIPASPTVSQAHVLLMARDKAPVAWVPLEPVVGNSGQVALAARSPHPHAALLFLDYLLTDAEQVFHDNTYVTATDSVPFRVWVPEQGKTTSQIERDVKLWSDLFKSTFR
jgi:iron(III) transport system substrate-binding protein